MRTLLVLVLGWCFPLAVSAEDAPSFSAITREQTEVEAESEVRSSRLIFTSESDESSPFVGALPVELWKIQQVIRKRVSSRDCCSSPTDGQIADAIIRYQFISSEKGGGMIGDRGIGPAPWIVLRSSGKPEIRIFFHRGEPFEAWVRFDLGKEMRYGMERRQAQPGATDNPDDAR